MPWDYQDIVRRHLRPGCRVLDIGTGGERFLETMPLIGAGTGIDASPDMVAAARANTPAELAGKVSFAVMPSERLELPDADFDLVLNGNKLRELRPRGGRSRLTWARQVTSGAASARKAAKHRRARPVFPALHGRRTHATCSR